MKQTFVLAAAALAAVEAHLTSVQHKLQLAQLNALASSRFYIGPDNKLKVTFVAQDLQHIGQCFGLSPFKPIWMDAKEEGFSSTWDAFETIYDHIQDKKSETEVVTANVNA